MGSGSGVGAYWGKRGEPRTRGWVKKRNSGVHGRWYVRKKSNRNVRLKTQRLQAELKKAAHEWDFKKAILIRGYLKRT